MDCHGNSERIRLSGGGICRALVLGSLLLLVLLAAPSCVQLFGPATDTVEIDVVPGELERGRFFEGQMLRATTLVYAGRVYYVEAVILEPTGASIGVDELDGTVSGAPLAQPVNFIVEVSTTAALGGSGEGSLFAPLEDGEVTIEFAYMLPTTAASSGETLQSVRDWISGPIRAEYELLLIDLGFDDNGTSPEEAVWLPIGPDGEQTGTLTPGDEADYFTSQVQAETSYRLNLEATESTTVTSGFEDRFGQVNFGVATGGGLLLTGTATAGVPAAIDFTAPLTEVVHFRLTDGSGGTFDPTSATIQYAVSIEVVVPEEPEEEEPPTPEPGEP